MKAKIYRYGFIPVYNLNTDEYTWKKLKVIKVWVKPTSGFSGFEVQYVMENCFRFGEENLITEDKTKTMCPKLLHTLMVRSFGGGFISKTIFPPNTEICARKQGNAEFETLIKESKEEIKNCIEHDYIIGEKNVLTFLND